jgi:hypothetical protein
VTGEFLAICKAMVDEGVTPGQLLAEPPESWAEDWKHADADSFRL